MSAATLTRPAATTFPFLSHRTVAEIAAECGPPCLTPDRISTVPIVEGPLGSPDCWQFLFVIPGDRA